MKTFFTRMTLVTAIIGSSLLAVSCDDGDGKGVKPAEVTGSYALSITEKDNGAGTVNELCLTITPVWTVDWSAVDGYDDVQKAPYMVDISPMMGYPAGSVRVSVKELVDMVEPMLSNFVKGALVGLDLLEDGSFGASFHEFLSSGHIAQDFMSPKFAAAVSKFPSNDDPLPGDLLSWFSDEKAKKIYLSVDKTALESVMEGLVETIDLLLNAYPNLPVASSPNTYALGLNYTLSGNVLKISLDRATIAPFVPVITMLLASQEVDLGGLDVEEMLTKLLATTSELEIALYLKRV